MEDERSVTLFWQRNEAALTETASKYGRYLHSIAFGILASAEDAEECVNDTYIDAWNAMPPHRPALLSTFLESLPAAFPLTDCTAIAPKSGAAASLHLHLRSWRTVYPGRAASRRKRSAGS